MPLNPFGSISVPTAEPMGAESEVAGPTMPAHESATAQRSEDRANAEVLRDHAWFPRQVTRTVDAGAYGVAAAWSVTLKLVARNARCAYVKNLTGNPVNVYIGGEPNGVVSASVATGHWEVVVLPENVEVVTFAGVGAAASALAWVSLTDACWTPGEGPAA